MLGELFPGLLDEHAAAGVVVDDGWQVPDSRSTWFWSQVVIDTDSVDLAGHRVMGVAASGSVLDRSEVAQRRVTMPMIMFVLEIADDDTSLEQVGPMVAVEALPS